MPATRRAGRVGAASVLLTALLMGAGSGQAPAVGESAAVVSVAHAGTRTVEYDGMRVRVPRRWPVYRFGPKSRGCVRFDEHAVYLGEPAISTCPPGIVGQVDAVQIRRATARPVHEGARINRHGLSITGGDRIEPERVVGAKTGGAEVIVTSGPNQVVADGIAASIREIHSVPFASQGWASYPMHAETRAARPATSPTATGQGFDACTAPSVATVQAWNASPYRTLGVYVGGAQRACSQANLTSSWVNSVIGMGWSLIPTYVGLQAPCTSFGQRIDPAQAGAQGSQSADDAINDVNALGLGVGTPIYFDMEGYSTSDTSCVQAVEAFLDAWTARLRARGYLSGVYSSAASGIINLVQNAGNASFHLPDDIWFAHWNGAPGTTGDWYVPDGLWANHQRIHQYQGGHNETYGGVTLNIDSDSVDADTVTAISTSGDGSTLADGTFVQVTGSADVYEIAGGAPMYVSDWAAVGGVHPVSTISQAQFDALNPVPSDGTYLADASTGTVYVVAGGAAFAVKSWNNVPTPHMATRVDHWDIANAGQARAHLTTWPMMGTRVTAVPSGGEWVFTAHCRARTTTVFSGVTIDDFGLAPYPTCNTASLTHRQSSSRVVYGAKESLSVALTDGTTGRRVGGATLQLQRLSGRSWVALADEKTSTSGVATAVVVPRVMTTYRWFSPPQRVGGSYYGEFVSGRFTVTVALASAAPIIRGTMRTGRTVTARPGAWRPTGVTFRYQWILNGRLVARATHATYRIRRADCGKRLSVRVTGARTGYAGVTRTSTSRTCR